MADDVVSFFKSKKSKKPGGHHHHGAAVQTADELARRLELTVQQQQALDRENGADAADEDDYGNPIAVYAQPLSAGNNVASGAGGAGAEKHAIEDSEWLDVEQEADIDLTKFGIKEMEITEDNESLSNADDEALANRKTWNINNNSKAQKTDAKADESNALLAGGDAISAVDSTKEANEESAAGESSKEDTTSKEPTAEATEAKPAAAYVPPSMRNKQAGGGGGGSYSMRPAGKKPNIEDAEEFPSLDVASKLEEEQEKTKKKKPPPPSFHKAPSPSPASGWPSKRTPIPPPPTDRQKALAAAAAVAEPAAEPAAKSESPPPPAPAQEEKPSEPKQPARPAYVPPHLRNK